MTSDVSEALIDAIENGEVVTLSYGGSPLIHLLVLLSAAVLAAKTLLEGSHTLAVINAAIVLYNLLWFDRNVAVFVPPYSPAAAAQEITDVLGGRT